VNLWIIAGSCGESSEGLHVKTRLCDFVLEGKPDGKDAVVVVGVEVRGGDLKAPANAETEALVEVEAAEDDAGGHEDLGFAVVRAIVVMRVVHFQFRPESAADVVLERVVPGIGVADFVLVAGGKSYAKGALNIETVESLTVSDGGSDDGVGGAILVLAGGKSGLEEGGEDVVAILFVGGEKSIFDQEAPVAETVFDRRIVVDDIGRGSDENDFDMASGNEFESFGAAVIFGGDAGVVGLPEDVVAEFFFEARSCGGDGGDPMRLLSLSFVDAGEPVGEKVAGGTLSM